jgi:hypothetical protein
MPFGILDCKKLETVPGTSFMSDQDDLPPEYAELPRDALKHGVSTTIELSRDTACSKPRLYRHSFAKAKNRVAWEIFQPHLGTAAFG